MTETDTMILFWDGTYSQWEQSQFYDENGIRYNCCEQYMMAEKARFFNDKPLLKAIMTTLHPRDQKALGRTVGKSDGSTPFDEKTWDAQSRIVVFKGNLFKFTQNPDMMAELLQTGDKIIVEASPYDKIWGIGLAEDDPRALDKAQWQGLNLLGEAVMQVRAVLLGNVVIEP
jgi:ribA/ribD-fused uncharacterized protein